VTVTVGELVATKEAELTTGPFGTQLKAAEYVDSGVPVINVRNIGLGTIREADLEYIGENTVTRLSRHVLRTGDIVFGRKGAVERHAFIRDTEDGWFQGSDCLRLRLVSERYDSRFVSYCMLTDEHKQWMINQGSHGSTMASLNQGILFRIALPDLPIAGQHKIVAILSAYDDLIENNSRRIRIMEEMAQRIYHEWFLDFRYPGHGGVAFVDSELGLIPEGWEVHSVREVARLVRGQSYRGTDVAECGGTPFVTLKCVDRGGGFRRDGIKAFTGQIHPDRTVSAGDIVVAVTDMTQERRIVARAARVPLRDGVEAVMSMDLVKLEPRDIPSAFLLGMLRYSGFAEEVKQHANGANVLHLHPDRILDYRFAVPPSRLLASYAQVADNTVQLEDALGTLQDSLRTARDLLLPRLISGEIDVDDLDIPTGESAA
jgi:type I restriction enzyme S subunit